MRKFVGTDPLVRSGGISESGAKMDVLALVSLLLLLVSPLTDSYQHHKASLNPRGQSTSSDRASSVRKSHEQRNSSLKAWKKGGGPYYSKYSGIISSYKRKFLSQLAMVASSHPRRLDTKDSNNNAMNSVDKSFLFENLIDSTELSSIKIVKTTPVFTQNIETINNVQGCYTNDYKPVIIGIAGGSASGKSTLTKQIVNALGEEHISYISHDSYYKDLSHLSLQERAVTNFDHPDSLDTYLLKQHIVALKNGEEVDTPVYDFTTHSRISDKTVKVEARRIVIVDGILLFSDPELCDVLDMKIYVDTDDDIRLIRRIKRDTVERGRSVDSVIEQYQKYVRPMHEMFVEPSKRKADIIVPASQVVSTVALEMCVSRLREIINFCQ